MPDFVIGQTVYIRWSEYSHRGRQQTVLEPEMITKIGRKWVSLGYGRRFDCTHPKFLLDGDQCSSPGRVYLSPEAWEQEKARAAAWATLRKAVESWNPPDEVTMEDIQTACRALGIDPGPG